MHVVAGSLAAGFLAVFTAGSTSEWQPAIEVPDAAVGDIALNASGDAIAVWTRRSGELVASYRPAGSQRWPSPLSLDTTVDAAAQVAINDREMLPSSGSTSPVVPASDACWASRGRARDAGAGPRDSRRRQAFRTIQM